MTVSTFIGLINNAALLVSLVLIYDLVFLRQPEEKASPKQIPIGLILGIIGLAIMVNPWEFLPGIIFDTRSILLSVCGLFFGMVPTVTATILTGGYRLYLGGAGAWTGFAVIVISGAVGLGWRHFMIKNLDSISNKNLFLMGCVTHVLMLLLMLTLPRAVAFGVLSKITLPVMLIFPVGTVLLGRLFINSQNRIKSEQLLKESEARFKALHNASFGGIAIHDQGIILECNQGLSEMTGYQYSELIGMNGLLLIAEKSRETVMNNIRNGYEKPYEAFGLRKTGEEFPMQLEARNVPYRGKQVRTVEFRDITERKQAEKALESNYALLRIAGETAKFGGWSVDLEQNICTWSDAVADIHDVPHGYAPPVQEGINFYALEWREKITQRFRACAKEGIHYDEEMEIITQKGKRVWVRTTGKAVKNEKDKIIKVQGSFQDITDRKQVEQALVEQKDLLAAIYRNAPLVIMVVNAERRIQQVNGFATQFAGRAAEEMLGLRGGEALRCLHVLDDPRGCGFGEFCQQCVIRNTVLDTLETGKTHLQIEVPYYFKGQDNKTRELQLLMSTTPVEVKGERLALLTLQDITERKQAETEQVKLQEQLNQSQKMESVGRLAGGVAHDFNNMLGVILGHTELALLQADENHELHDDLKEIHKAAKRSADITKQLLAFARKQTISPEQLDLNDTVESMLNMLRRLIGEDIDLVWQPAAHIWPVEMDPSQIDQILANLCVNARDAISGVGKLTIETGRKTFDEEYCKEHAGFIPGDFVLLAVSDNGCGMDKETLENLFEPFYTTKDSGKGTGLGLATVYGIVKQNNGFINVYSEPGQGSTFKIYLSRLVVDEDIGKAVPEKTAAVGGTETILLVEDEPSILRMTRIMLERKGYSVLPAATPGEAIDLAKTHSDKIHLLMTDVVMPEMNGRDLAGKLTALYPDIRLMFMSGYTANVIAHHGVLDAGVAFIQKPFSMTDLMVKVREVLGKEPDETHV
ncbi:PAS domain S-box protein [Desulfotignum balticum]|uniref:PAS domain S-box protein n=1 Tax=Desulfotignum balticum TaxID=115781 RepID=UPI0009FC05C7|nr:PAS domain S-box protein [Desulfotignum balticum]